MWGGERRADAGGSAGTGGQEGVVHHVGGDDTYKSEHR